MKKRLTLPEGYSAALDLITTEKAIKFIKDGFQNRMADNLNLQRVSAPLIVAQRTGINDYLNGWEQPARFNIRDMNESGEIVQSLAKWKRIALADYGFEPGQGLYTDMNAIRPDEELDNIHSLYVDQWDWERIMHDGERHLDFLRSIVTTIYAVIRATEVDTCLHYPELGSAVLPPEIHFIHAEELLQKYPELDPKERENKICREHGAVFVIGIGHDLSNQQPHDGRAADYDDWSTQTGNGRYGLNGDILVWNSILNRSYELSSMGIRVNTEALKKQLAIRDEEDKTEFLFHKRLLNGELPQTIGGGIGQSRLCMFFLKKAHIGEIQASIWPDEMRTICFNNGIRLL
ncbi:aspartate--ammonia ligase [bacterium]|nr:aspartate--ammonia ligase [bacterium]